MSQVLSKKRIPKKRIIVLRITPFSKRWFCDDYSHRGNDQPAVIWSDGIKEWYVDGSFARDNDE